MTDVAAPSAASAPTAPASAAPSAPKPTDAAKTPATDAKASPTPAVKAGDATKPDAKEQDEGKAEGKKEEASGPKSYKLVVKGKEVEVPAEHYHRLAQKGLAADVTLQQFAEIEKATGSLIASLKDPKSVWKVLERLGHDPLKIASELVYDRGVRRESMTPEARELEDLKARQAEEEEAKKRQEQEALTQKEAAAVRHYQQAFSKDIIAAMDSAPELPKTAETVSRLAFHMRQALRAREEGDETPIRASEFVPKVLEEYRAAARALLASRQGKDILDLLGDDVRTRVRKAELEAVNAGPRPSQNGSDPAPAPSNAKRKPMSKDEWDALVAQRAGM